MSKGLRTKVSREGRVTLVGDVIGERLIGWVRPTNAGWMVTMPSGDVVTDGFWARRRDAVEALRMYAQDH